MRRASRVGLLHRLHWIGCAAVPSAMPKPAEVAPCTHTLLPTGQIKAFWKDWEKLSMWAQLGRLQGEPPALE